MKKKRKVEEELRFERPECVEKRIQTILRLGDDIADGDGRHDHSASLCHIPVGLVQLTRYTLPHRTISLI